MKTPTNHYVSHIVCDKWGLYQVRTIFFGLWRWDKLITTFYAEDSCEAILMGKLIMKWRREKNELRTG